MSSSDHTPSNTHRSTKTKVETPLRVAEMLNGKVGTTTKNPLAAYALLPLNVDFENQEPGEKVLLLLRSHPITNTRWILGIIGTVFASVAFFNPPMVEAMINLKIPRQVFLYGYVLLYLLLFAYAIERFLLWFFNVFIVTNRRLVDIDLNGLLAIEISDTPLYRIQDVTYRQNGFSESLFDYGNVVVQTAATEEKIDFTSVPKPGRVADLISELIQLNNYESGASK